MLLADIDGIIIINLKHRADKLEKCFEILDSVNVPHERVIVLEATYIPTNGAKGCSHSHYRAIKMAKELGFKNVLVLEDDFSFNVTIDTFNRSLSTITTSIPNWDVIMLEWGLNGMEKRTSAVSECNLVRKLTHKNHGAWRTVAYFANASIYNLLIKNFFKSYRIQRVDRNVSNKNYAIDCYWQRLQRFHNWYICTPKLMVCRDFLDSDIR